MSRDLERIVAHCLETNPSRRYHSAFDLADDLGRFLEGRPVSVRPVSMPVRLAKWARRRPALATATLLLILLAVGLAVGASYHFVQLRVAFDRLQAEQGRTREARDRSQRALNTLTDDVVQGMLDRGSVLNDKDLAFLRKVRGYYQEPVLDGDSESAESLRFRANGLLRVAELCRRIGQAGEGVMACEGAIAVFSKILEAYPDDPSAAVDRANAHRQLCTQLDLGGRKAEGLEVARKMLDEFRPYVGTSIDRRVTLLGCNFVLADRIAAVGRREEAEVAYAEAAGIARGLREAKGADPAFRRIEYVGLFNRGYNLRRLGRYDRADSVFRDALKLAEEHSLERPADLYWMDRTISCMDRLVDVRILAGREADAVSTLVRQRQAIRVRGERFPGDPLQAVKELEVATSWYLLRKQRPLAEIEAILREAIASGKKRLAEDKANYSVYTPLSVALQNLGELLEEANRNPDALDAYDQAWGLAEPWLKSGQQPEIIRDYLKISLHDSSRILHKLGRTAEAIERVERAISFADEEGRPPLRLSLARYRLAAGNRSAAREAALLAAEHPQYADEANKLIAKIDLDSRPPAANN